MEKNIIVSKENQFVKQIRALQQKKYRDEKKEFLVEGVKMVKEALMGQEAIEKIVVCDEKLSRQEWLELEEMCKTKGIKGEKIVHVSKQILNYIGDTMSPQGVMAVLKQKETTFSYSNLVFALDNLQDPGNLGTIIRTLDAAGIQDLIVSSDTVELYNPKVVRSTMGAIFRLHFHFANELTQELKKLQALGYEIVITSLKAKSYYYDLDFTKKMVIAIGNEAKGVSAKVQELANKEVKIPMLGQTESLNAAVATSIIAYESVRQKIM